MTASAPRRWRPSRAGILNVYQYEDETLHFADGRLLLRGVNGSGKSTAMNMLLPFLLEANTRRIDAAGEQSGVLKSWMLSDNEETQRTGYLWIEFARPDDAAPGGTAYRTVGCGIRANRSTDRVSTWWFSTHRRARIDFSLTSAKVPLSVDALRAELGSESVFGTATEYQAEVSRRFFGGADPAGYFGLLHQVRNPRVGDRVDTDLPQRLREALPPVPEEAVRDAAQPLEDLEGHRLNVRGLEQTERALGSVLDVYRQYARRVLRSAAARAGDAVGAARSAQQKRGRLRTAAEQARTSERAAIELVRQWERGHREAQAELAGLKNLPAYKNMQALKDRREVVAGVEAQAGMLERQRDTAASRLARARGDVDERRTRVDRGLRRIGRDLDALAGHARSAATRLPLPDPPVLRVTGADPEGPDPEVDPLAGFDLRPAGDAVRSRRREIADVRDRLEASDSAQAASAEADRNAEQAE
ncbi:MAG: hypothetical protein M3235_07565, partial [Actinomycetota bacterium]|nr:hypothetical protein [Actinomycetota bacterium]